MSDQPHRHINPWLIAISVMFATFMEVLDTTVVNVSLPHIAGSLSATVDEATRALNPAPAAQHPRSPAASRRGGQVGAALVPRGQRDHPADDRLARDALRAQAAADA